MRPIWLHIGAPKAGSTALQRWCLTNRAALLAQGLLYPGREERHQALLSTYHPAPETLAYHRGAPRAQARRWAAYRAEGVAADMARHPQATVLLSNEHLLSYAAQIDLARLRDDLMGQGDLRALIVLRDPVEAMVARSFEEVKSGEVLLKTVLKHPKLLPLDGLAHAVTTLGPARTTLIRHRKGRIVEDVLAQIAPGIDLTKTVPISPQNATLTLEATATLSAHNQAYAAIPRLARAVTADTLQGQGHTPFTLPGASIRAQRGSLEAQYALLARLGLPFDPPDWDALP